MYSYKLDDVVFNDGIVGIDSISRTIARGWNGTGIDNVLRKRTESSLTFTGEAYAYILSKFDNICESINLKVYDNDGLIFIEGTFYSYMCTFNLSKGECETQIKDTSWSSLFVDRADSLVNLRSIKSFDCSIDIDKLLPISVDFFDINGVYTYTNKQGFDVLQVLQKIVEFWTNGQMTLSSDYLTNNKYAIFIGTALIPLTETPYFNISFQQIFENLRKLFSLYLVIDGNNIVLEPETDLNVFGNTTVLSFTDIPFNTTATVDVSRQVKSAIVGSDEVTDDKVYSDEYLPLNDRWSKQEFQNCSCTTIPDNDLDLVVDFIIDSDTILDTLINSNYNDKFFLVKLDDLDITKAKKSVVIPTNIWYYNNEFRNIAQLNNWQTYLSNCFFIGRGNNAGFEALGDSDPNNFAANNTFVAGSTTCDILIQYDNHTLDPFNRFAETNGGKLCNTPSGGNVYTSYTVLQSGFYAFEAERFMTWVPLIGGTVSVSFLIQVFEDVSMTTVLYQYISNYSVASELGGVNLDVITDALFLAPNNYVVVKTIFTSTIGIGGVLYGGYFRSADQVLACIDQLESNNNYKYRYEFNTNICNADFDVLDQNKNEIINVAGADMWIKEVTQDIKGGANFVLLSNDIINNCNGS